MSVMIDESGDILDSGTEAKHIVVPYVEIQADFVECISDALTSSSSSSSFFINVQESSDGILFEERVDVTVDQDGQCEFKCLKSKSLFAQNGKEYRYCNKDIDLDVLFQIPYKSTVLEEKNTLGSGAISGSYTCIDATSDGEKIVLGDMEGCLHILESSSNELDVCSYKTVEKLNSHVGFVTKVCIFPSDKVVLSASIDKTIQLYSLQDEYSNPRTFKGHTESIRDLQLVGNGRNFLSCSDDGTIKLWECGSGLCVYSFRRLGSGFNGNPILSTLCLKDDGFYGFMATAKRENNLESSSTSSLEFDTKGCVVFGTHESGHISCFDLHSKEQILEIPSPFEKMKDDIACTSIAYSGEQQSHLQKQKGARFTIYSSYSNGSICEWELSTQVTDGKNTIVCRMIKLIEFQKNCSIQKIAINENKLYVTSEYDANVVIDLSTTDSVDQYLVCDSKSINDFKIDSVAGKMYVAGSDGLFGIYSL